MCCLEWRFLLGFGRFFGWFLNFFFYSVRLKTINPSLTITAMLQTELPDQDSIVFNQKEKRQSLQNPTAAHPTHSSLFGSIFNPCDCPTRVENKSINFDILGCIGVRISCSWGQIPISTGCFFPNTHPALVSPGAAQSLPLSSKSCARREQQQQRAELGSGCFVLSRTKCVEMGFSFRLPSRSHSFCFWRGAL